jgi:Flp pilus assembly pilin Flp
MWPGYLKLVLKLQSLGTQQSGQDLVEYALLMAFLTAALTASTKSLAIVITTEFTNIATYFTSVV